jgi:copper chaperone
MKITSILVGLFLSLSVFASRVEVEIDGMSCGMCVEHITKELSATQKVENLKVSLENKKANFDEIKGKKISDSEIKSAISKAGYIATKIRRY